MGSKFMQQFLEKKNIAGRCHKKYLEEALYKNLYRQGGKENKVREQLNNFIRSKKSVFKWEVGKTLKDLRSRKLYGPALKLSETMEKKRGMNKTSYDQAVHLDLVAKVKGIAAAEAYFTDLPDPLKNYHTYGTLLNCYCKNLMTEKAEALLEKMKELDLELGSGPYNSLMTLYSKIGEQQKIPAIIQEMKASDILQDTFTYNVWMRSLASVNDISGVERVIDEMKRDDRVAADWTTYSNLASIYADAGLSYKAETALKELESRNTPPKLPPYQFLITLYGRTGNIPEVHRVWQSLKLAFPKTANISYLNMIQVLLKLNDLPGAEKCFEEWEANVNRYDIRVANTLIGAYLKEGLFDKAEVLKEQAQQIWSKPNAKTWELYLDYYLNKGETKSAVDCIVKAISTGRGDGSKWTPSSAAVADLMQQFEQNVDVEGAESFLEVLIKSNKELGAAVIESWIRIYAAAGKKSSVIPRRVKMENVELSEEGIKLLNDISDQ